MTWALLDNSFMKPTEWSGQQFKTSMCNYGRAYRSVM